MLVEEGKETSTVVLADPLRGLGYQVAGAFQRLGVRLMGLVEPASSAPELNENSLKHLLLQPVPLAWKSTDPTKAPSTTELSQPLGQLVFNTLILTPEPALARNLAPSKVDVADLERLARAALRVNSQTHVIAVLPSSSADSLLETFLELGERVTILLTSAVFGFRDEGVMSEALKWRARNPALLHSTTQAASDVDFIYAGDVASFLVTAPQRTELFGKVIAVPSTVRGLQDWLQGFREAFRVAEGSLSQRLLAKFALKEFGSEITFGRPLSSRRVNTEPALNLFPTALTPLKRALQQSASAHERDPALGLHFPPSRAL